MHFLKKEIISLPVEAEGQRAQPFTRLLTLKFESNVDA
jgi:hypothetical protein